MYHDDFINQHRKDARKTWLITNSSICNKSHIGSSLSSNNAIDLKISLLNLKLTQLNNLHRQMLSIYLESREITSFTYRN